MPITDPSEHTRRNLIEKNRNDLFCPGFCCKTGANLEIEPPVLLSKQSFRLPGTERIHLSMLAHDGPDNFLDPFYFYNDVRTMYDLIRKGLVRSNNGNCLGYRPDDQSGYLWLSYKTVLDRCVNFGRGLSHLGVKENEFVGIYSKNRVEWVLAEQGIYSFSMASVPLYDTLGPTACNFIITQAEITTVVLETEKNLLAILDNVPACLKTIIYMDDLSSDAIVRAKAFDLRLYKFSEVEKIGEMQKKAYPEKPPKPDDIANLSYTSGTTGIPKGVIITHSGFVSCMNCSIANLRYFPGELMGKDDVLFSFLPLAHMYEKVLEVMGAAKESLLKRIILETALRFKGKEVDRGVVRKNSIWDLVVFRKVQNAMGGRVRLVLSGGSPVNADVLKFFRCALGCQVLEGYGQTESSGIVSMTLPHDTTGGHVGPPVFGIAIKLVDVPEMNYYSKYDEGELCLKGAMICKGYYKNEEETQKIIDEDGWLHTGDIATWLPEGTVKIIDRKKNIFKLSQGEYVAPEKIEIIYTLCTFVAQIFVYGDSLESFLVAIVVPEEEAFKKLFPSHKNLSSLCKDPNVKARILDELTKLGRENGLKSFEQVKNIYLHPDPFTVEQDFLTPTMKLKRPELKKFFEPQIKQMYKLT